MGLYGVGGFSDVTLDRDGKRKTVASEGLRRAQEERDTRKKAEEAPAMAERRFQEQCFLVDNLHTLKNKHVSNYENFSVVRGGDAKRFITRASTSYGVEGLHNATAEQLSGLVPEIKLWKIFYPSETSKGIEVHLPFENYLKNNEVENMTRNRATRGAGAGIQSFEWDLEGTQLYESQRLITARLSLVFQDMNSLSKVLNVTEKDGVRFETRYLDLFHGNKKFNAKNKDETGEDCESQVYNEKYFRIKAKVGWSAHKDHSLHEAAKKTGYTFFLSLNSHDITFNEDATIQVVLNYQATIDSIMRDFRSDILLMGANEDLTILENAKKCFIEEVSKTQSKEGKRDKDAKKAEDEKIEQDRKLLEQKINEQRGLQYRRFFEKLINKTPLYYVDTTPEQIGQWFDLWSTARTEEELEEIRNKVNEDRKKVVVSSGPATDEGGEFKKKNVQDMDKAISSKNKIDLGSISSESDIPVVSGTFFQWVTSIFKGSDPTEYTKTKNVLHRIHYMTLGSILDTALSVLGDNKHRLSEIRSVVADIKYVNPRTNQPESINLSDIPISLNLFQTWYFDQCVSSNRTTWDLREFIKSAIDDLFLAAVSDRCFPCAGGFKKPRLNAVALQIPLNGDGTCLITGKKGVKEGNLSNAREGKSLDELLSQRERTGWSYDNVGHYFFLHMAGESLSINEKPNRNKDFERGIHHLHIGSSRGMVKRISFSKEEDPHIRAYRITEGDAPLGSAREIYNASVEMIGNTFYHPGSYVYIDSSTSAFGSFDSGETVGSQIGLGGYYRILRVNSEITSGEYVSRIDCRYEGKGGGKIKKSQEACDAAKKPPIREWKNWNRASDKYAEETAKRLDVDKTEARRINVTGRRSGFGGGRY